MKNLILKPGSYELANGKQQPGGDLGRFILDWLVSKSLLTTTDCCTYTLVGGGGGTVSTNVLAFNPTTRVLTSTVEGIASSITLPTTTANVTTSAVITVGLTTYPIGTLLTTVLAALAVPVDLGYTASPSQGTITNTGGTNSVIPLGDATNAGLLRPAQYPTIESLITASTVNRIPYAGAGTTYLSDPKLTWTPGTSTLLVDGKLTVTGLIDPTGMEFTQQATNPGLVPANTVWISSATGNLMVGDRNLETNTAQTISANTTLTNTSRIVFASGTINVTLPVGTVGQIIDIKNMGIGVITVLGNMDSSTSFPLTSFPLTSAVSQGFCNVSASQWALI